MRSFRKILTPETRLGSWVRLWIPMFMLAIFDVLAAWQDNRYQVFAVDLVIPIILCVLIASITSLIFIKTYRREPLTGFIGASIATLLFSGDFESRVSSVSSILKAFNPIHQLYSWESVVYAIIFATLCVFLSLWIGRKVNNFWIHKNWSIPNFLGGVTVTIGVIFALQALPVIFSIGSEWQQFSYIPPALPNTAHVTSDKGKPDIYYIVLDRYASQSVLQNQFGYDNSKFISFLHDQGFSVDPNAHQNYPYTTMSIASTMNANYLTDIVQRFGGSSNQTIDPFHQAIRNGAVIQQLKSLGYTYDELGSWYEASNFSPLADKLFQPDEQLTIFGETLTVNTFTRNALTSSIFWRFLQHGLSFGNTDVLTYNTINEVSATQYKLSTLHTLATQASGGRFIFAHILVPHDPYYFNADGSLNPNGGNDNVGEQIKQKYVNQVEYINSQITSVITDINTASKGNAVVIVQSDEGPYPNFLNDNDSDGTAVDEELASGSMLDWSNLDLQMKYGNLAAYKVPAATPEAIQNGGDNVNIFRVVLNSYFNDTLQYLPHCYYGYKNGREESFNFTNINQQLTGSTNPACAPDSNFSKKF